MLSRNLKFLGDVYSSVRLRARPRAWHSATKNLRINLFVILLFPVVGNHWVFNSTTQDRILRIHPRRV